MSYIETSSIKNTTTMLIYSERNEIKLDPPYQRMGDIWPLEKKQLLIDSILNDYDIPKIYFHIYARNEKIKTGISYSVIDGRQRLETIWQFIEGKFNLSTDFEYQRDPSINLASLSYSDIAKEHPKIRIQFDSFVLPIIGVITDDEDLIEDMFSRLNEAVSLNAAEKRNAKGGCGVNAIRTIATHDFFTKKVRFRNTRYQYFEVSGRILLTEENLIKTKRLIDTKKAYLDRFVQEYKKKEIEINNLISIVEKTLKFMCDIFTDEDELLRSQGNIIVYYLLCKKSYELNEQDKVTRRKLLDFKEKIQSNRKIAADDYTKADFELLEYDSMTRQGTNDASNIKERFRVLAKTTGLSSTEI